MKNFLRIISGLFVFAVVPAVFAPSASATSTLIRGYEERPTDMTYWCDQTKYTPRERIRVNMIKGRNYPPLKGRWNPDHTTPASGIIMVEPGDPRLDIDRIDRG